MQSKLAAMILAGALMAPATHAFAADQYAIDPDHAWVTFATNHAGWSTAHGLFHKVAGTISFDHADVTKSTVAIEIDAASIDTNFDQRNSDLRSPDFFNAAEFPKISFKSTAVTKTGERTGKVTGNMTLIGVTKPVTLDVTWNDEKPLPWDASVVKTGFSATTKVNALDFGMAKVTDYGLGPEVKLTIDVEAIKK